MKLKKIFVCCTNDNDVDNFVLTDDENLAKQKDNNYRLATVDDLEFFTAATDVIIKGILFLQDGYYTYCTKKISTGQKGITRWEWKCGYEKLV